MTEVVSSGSSRSGVPFRANDAGGVIPEMALSPPTTWAGVKVAHCSEIASSKLSQSAESGARSVARLVTTKSYERLPKAVPCVLAHRLSCAFVCTANDDLLAAVETSDPALLRARQTPTRVKDAGEFFKAEIATFDRF